MAINIIESVQQKLQVDELQKIDPDTGKAKNDDEYKTGVNFYQVAIPAVLTGLYRFTRTDEKNKDIFNVGTGKLLSLFFGENSANVIAKIAEITHTAIVETRVKMEEIAAVGINVLKENLSDKTANSDVKDFLTSQRHNILVYLDPQLQLGHLIEDDTVDDTTNKMEGPVSDFMHTVGQIFSSSGNDKKEDL
ncbi:MAG: hypothetical protein M3Z92_06490 [Bacteroidota bacterium]|nr:hypothetical protein [Bacteroidota bacterium]